MKEGVKKETSILPSIGKKIQGDFFGDERRYLATGTKVKPGEGNPLEAGTPDGYEVKFSGHPLNSIKVGCCDIRLVNEGDLNNDEADEISIFQAPTNGCTYSMTTYSFIKGTWKPIVGTFLIPTDCDHISDEDLQKRIYKEQNTIYYYETDLNDENRKLIKKKAGLN